MHGHMDVAIQIVQNLAANFVACAITLYQSALLPTISIFLNIFPFPS